MPPVRNPFFNRHRIADPAYFCGRHEELEQLYGAILTGQCRAIVGERKMGKSSLLSHLSYPGAQRRFGLDPERYLFAYLDMEGLTSATRSEFWQEALEQICAGLHPEDLRTLFRNALHRAEIRFMGVRQLFRRVRDAGLCIVLALDEFEALAQNPHFEPDFYSELRSLAGEMGVVYFTASRRSLYELTYRNSHTLSSPFFNIFSELPLALMPAAEVRDLLARLSQAGGEKGFGPAEVNLALEWAGPHPFFAQLAGYYLWEGLAGLSSPSLGEEGRAGERGEVQVALETAYRRFLAEAEDHYRYLWAQLEENEHAGVLHPETVSEETRRHLQRRGVLLSAGSTWIPFSASFADFACRQERSTPSTPVLPAPPSDDLTGQNVGPYRVLERCGEGGMAEVYKGYHPLIDRYVAIKVLRPSFSGDEEFRTRFQREATAVAALRHPNIVQLHDFGQLGDRFYMAMEFIDGGTLRERLEALQKENKRMPPADVVAVVRGVAAALDYAHRRGIVHRDVKPGNIMFTCDGDPVLTDFGIARLLRGGAVTMAGMSVGTPDYMSPEQGMGEPATPHSDVYSLGVILYEMLTGKRPFNADTPFGVILQHIQASFPSPRGEDPSFPETLERVLRRALAKDPQERYTTAGELAQELQATLEEQG